MPESFSRLLEVHRRCGNPGSDQTIGKARDYIGFECKSRNAHPSSSKHGRARGVSANADHYVGTKLKQDSARFPYGSWKIENSLRPSCKTHIFQRTDFNQS